MSDMKLIMESWRNFQESDIKSDLLFEGTERQVSFGDLIYDYNNKVITEQQISKLWIESFDYEANLLIQEVGILDALGKAKDKVVDAYNTFIAKQFLRVRDFLSGTLEKIKNSAGTVATILRKIIGWVGKFCDKAPVLCKITLGLATVFAVTMTMAIFADDAEASIKIGKKVYEADHMMLDTVKGLCGVISETAYDTETQNQAKNCISLINEHAASSDVVDVKDHLGSGGKLIKQAYATIKGAVSIAQEEQDVPLMKTILQLAELGKEQTLEITTKITKTVHRWESAFGSGSSVDIQKTVSTAGEMVPMKGKVDYTGLARNLGDIAAKTGK